MNEDEKEILKAGADAAMRPFANLMERLEVRNPRR
jgi:hypothetical protein